MYVFRQPALLGVGFTGKCYSALANKVRSFVPGSVLGLIVWGQWFWVGRASNWNSSVTAVLPPPGQRCETVCLNSSGNRTSPSDNSKSIELLTGSGEVLLYYIQRWHHCFESGRAGDKFVSGASKNLLTSTLLKVHLCGALSPLWTTSPS